MHVNYCYDVLEMMVLILHSSHFIIAISLEAKISIFVPLFAYLEKVFPSPHLNVFFFFFIKFALAIVSLNSNRTVTKGKVGIS
jgi:hypothetical protein